MYISDKIRAIADEVCRQLGEQFNRIDCIAQINTERVMDAFAKHRVSDSCFTQASGYGYNDKGREVLDAVFAEVFGTEAALVRINFVNGTHAITNALFSAVAPGDTLLYATGTPYDTLRSAIGIGEVVPGSLAFYGINYAEVPLLENGRPDIEGIAAAAADPKVKAVGVQRSCGYEGRPSLSAEEIGEIARIVHSVNPAAAVVVDNCYGEFTQTVEPTHLGADLIAGSLIKNPGGGLAPTGGYIAGRADLVERAAFRLTSPGIGGECGPSLGQARQLFQGLFMAPHTVAQAVKTAVFCAGMMEHLGLETTPASSQVRYDIIQKIDLGSPEGLKAFCAGIQAGAPVDSFVTPEPWPMPGYDVPVIMAAGAFIQGASIELSCDGPMAPPYRAYMQGGLTFESGKLGIMAAADRVLALK